MKHNHENLRSAFEQIALEMIRSVPETEYRSSMKLEKFIEHLDQKCQRKIQIKKRIIIAIAVIIMALAIALQFEPVRRFIQEKFEEYTRVFFSTSSEAPKNHYIADTFMVGALPDGFQLVDQVDMGVFTLYQFEDDTHYFRLQQYSVADYQSSLDTEYQDMERIEIGGHEGKLIQIDNETILIWTLEDSVFTLVGDLSRDDMIRIAGSIMIYS